eukprot:gene17730-21140_t
MEPADIIAPHHQQHHHHQQPQQNHHIGKPLSAALEKIRTLVRSNSNSTNQHNTFPSPTIKVTEHPQLPSSLNLETGITTDIVRKRSSAVFGSPPQFDSPSSSFSYSNSSGLSNSGSISSGLSLASIIRRGSDVDSIKSRSSSGAGLSLLKFSSLSSPSSPRSRSLSRSISVVNVKELRALIDFEDFENDSRAHLNRPRSRSEELPPSWEKSAFEGDFSNAINLTLLSLHDTSHVAGTSNIDELEGATPSRASSGSVSNDLVLDPTTGTVVAGTLDRIIGLLTDISTYTGTQYLEEVLYIYHYFTTDFDLLARLEARFEKPLTDAQLSSVPASEIQQISTHIKFRVINVLKKWAESHGYDFNTNPALYKPFNALLDRVAEFNPKWGAHIKKTVSSLVIRYINNSGQSRSQSSLRELLPLNDLETIAIVMSRGLMLKERKKNLRNIRASFLGTEAVDWVRNRFQFESRLQAVELLTRMLTGDLIRHYSDGPNKPFKDKETIYYFPKVESGVDAYPEPIVPKQFLPSTTFLDIHPVEIARQLTLIEFNLYCKITPSDLYHQAWNKKDAAEKVPNLLALIKRSNDVSYWVATICQKLNNWNTFMGIMLGLSLGSIQRLKKTWEGLPKTSIDLFQSLSQQTSASQNYGTYRKAIANASAPFMPYVAWVSTEMFGTVTISPKAINEVRSPLQTHLRLGYNLRPLAPRSFMKQNKISLSKIIFHVFALTSALLWTYYVGYHRLAPTYSTPKPDSPYRQESSLDTFHSSQLYPIEYGCDRTYTFTFGGPYGFGSEINMFFMAALLARYNGRTLLINGKEWNYGDYNRLFKTDHLPSCPNITIDELYRGNDMEIPPLTIRHAERIRGDWIGYIRWLKTVKENTLPFGVFRHTVQNLYRPSNEVRTIISWYIGNITNFNGQQDYYAVHIRRGDKTSEAQLYGVGDYLSLLESTIAKTENRIVKWDTPGISLFVASDEIDTVYAEAVSLRPKWQVFRASEFVHQSGHVQGEFNVKSAEDRFQETAYLMTEIEILTNAKATICTFSSNLCTVIQLLRTQPANTLASLDDQLYYDLRPHWRELNK